jgi:hypothetical protein
MDTRLSTLNLASYIFWDSKTRHSCTQALGAYPEGRYRSVAIFESYYTVYFFRAHFQPTGQWLRWLICGLVCRGPPLPQNDKANPVITKLSFTLHHWGPEAFCFLGTFFGQEPNLHTLNYQNRLGTGGMRKGVKTGRRVSLKIFSQALHRCGMNHIPRLVASFVPHAPVGYFEVQFVGLDIPSVPLIQIHSILPSKPVVTPFFKHHSQTRYSYHFDGALSNHLLNHRSLPNRHLLELLVEFSLHAMLDRFENIVHRHLGLVSWLGPLLEDARAN